MGFQIPIHKGGSITNRIPNTDHERNCWHAIIPILLVMKPPLSFCSSYHLVSLSITMRGLTEHYSQVRKKTSVWRKEHTQCKWIIKYLFMKFGNIFTKNITKILGSCTILKQGPVFYIRICSQRVDIFTDFSWVTMDIFLSIINASSIRCVCLWAFVFALYQLAAVRVISCQKEVTGGVSH